MQQEQVQAIVDAAVEMLEAGRAKHGWLLYMTPEQQKLADAVAGLRKGSPLYCGIQRPASLNRRQ